MSAVDQAFGDLFDELCELDSWVKALDQLAGDDPEKVCLPYALRRSVDRLHDRLSAVQAAYRDAKPATEAGDAQ